MRGLTTLRKRTRYPTADAALGDLRGCLVEAEELVTILGWADNRLGRDVPSRMRVGLREALVEIKATEQMLAHYLVAKGLALR